MSNHLFDLITSRIGNSEKIFIEALNERKITYDELLRQSAKYANAILATGVSIGDRTVVQVEKTPEMLMLYLGCIRAGVVFIPLNIAYTVGELEYFIGDSRPKLIICDPEKYKAISVIAQKFDAKVATLDSSGNGSFVSLTKDLSSDFTTVHRGASDCAAILYTSGTTGRSKGAMITHENLASNALTLVKFWRFTNEDVLIHALPIYHTHGLFVATNVILLAGGSMIFLPKFDAEEIIAVMRRATSFMGVPTFYTRLLKHPGLTSEVTSNMRLFVSGSAPLLAETHREWRNRTGHVILERYGMTETNMNTSNPYDGDRIAGTVGFPLPNVQIRICEPGTGNKLSIDEVGVIEVKGPNVFSGYWLNPQKTSEEFRSDGYFITGDLGKIDALGYVHIVGRAKDLIITGGFNVYPKEIENEIDALNGVIESAVIGLPHADFGEAIAAFVVPDSTSEPDETVILKSLDCRLAKFKIPKRVIFVHELPRNTMGKVQKNLLRDAYKNLYLVH